MQKLLGPYLVFLCSTVNGYEGTGRALSLKLISNLRRDAAGAAAGGGGGAAQTGRLLREVQLRADLVVLLLRGPRGGVAERPTVPGRRGRDARATGHPPAACDLFEVLHTLFSRAPHVGALSRSA